MQPLITQHIIILHLAQGIIITMAFELFIVWQMVILTKLVYRHIVNTQCFTDNFHSLFLCACMNIALLKFEGDLF